MVRLHGQVSLYAICAAMLPCLAHGQVTASAQQVAEPPGIGLPEVVVTAQRRSENVQKSSLAIAVITGADLVRQGVANPRDIATVAPSVSISQSGAHVQTNIRGAGDFAVNALAQQAVSYSIDGVVIGQGSQIGSNFYDLARIEVLKGPQGTLYGRNATGGAINLITNRPSHHFEGNLTAEYGNYDSKRVTGAINIPLSEVLAVRAAVNVVDRDGYLSDGTDDDKRQAVRLQALWDISSAATLRLFGDYAHTGGKGGGAVLWPRQPGTGKWTSFTDPRNAAALAAGTSVTVPGLGTFGLQGPTAPDSFIDNDVWSVGGELNVDVGDFATLTVIPAYRHQVTKSGDYHVGFLSITDLPNTDKQSSLEVRLAHANEKLKWVVGGFYFDDKARISLNNWVVSPIGSLVLPSFNIAYDDLRNENKSLAAFGEATFSVSDQLRLIGGLRYTEDTVSLKGAYRDLSPPSVRVPTYPLDGRRKFTAVSWRAGVEYDVNPTSMLFLTASKGSKSGGFYTAASTDILYNPEKLTAFTLGSRNRFFDNKLQANLELFYWKYRDQQLSSVGFTSNGNFTYLTRNAGASDPRGVELDVVWQPTHSDTFSVNLAYDHAKFKKFDIKFPAPLISILSAGANCRVPAAPSPGGGLPVYAIDCSGAPVPRTPEFSGSVTYGHTFELQNGGRVVATGNSTFATSRYLTADFFTPETKDKAYVLLNADATYTSPDEKYNVTVFVRNITNKAYYQGAFNDPLNGFTRLFGVQGAPNFAARSIAAPRTYGVRATVNF